MMADSSDPRPPLAEWILECYDRLCAQMADSDDHSFSREQAVDILLEADGLALEPEDATYALTRLLERGYVYEVDGEFRITTPET